jgi:hypothetical protein
MRIQMTTTVGRSNRLQAASVEAIGTAGLYHVAELGHGEGRILGTVHRGDSGQWFASIPGMPAQAPYRTRDQGIRGIAFEVASRRLAERIQARPDVCGQDMTLWRDEDIAMAEKGLPDHCILEPGHDGGHSVRPRA